MRINRTDTNFTVRRAADRQIHYAGQEKKHTKNTMNLSTKEKQDALRQGYGKGIGNRSGDSIASGNLHVKRPLQPYHQEQSLHGEQQLVGGQAQQQVNRPSSYRESTIKTKEQVLHRKADTPFSIKETDAVSLKEHKGKDKKIHKPELSGSPKVHKTEFTQKDQPEKPVENFASGNTKSTFPDGTYARSFSERREMQISGYKKGKYLEARKQERGRKEASERPDINRGTKSSKVQEIQVPLMQDTVGETALSKDTSRIHTKKPGDSIRQRDGAISGRKDNNSKKNKGKNKDTPKAKSHNKGKSKKDRAAAFRMLSYASDKLSQEEQRDSLLKVAKDLLLGRAKAAAIGKLLSIGASLVPVLIPVFIVAVIITLLFNSPFSILLPKLSEEPGAVEILAEYTEDFREKVEEELADIGSGDETELIYEDYEGDGEPDNMADILMVYMVKHGFGDTATVMTEKNRRALKDTFDEMTFMRITYRTEIVEQSYEEEDSYGNVTIRTEEVEIKIKEVRITLLTSEDIIRTGIFTEEETEILRYLMSPEILENIEGLTGGYGSPGIGSLTPEEAGRLNLGSDIGSQAVKNALAKLGKPYSQAKRDSGDYYDCSSLTYYAYKEAGINLSYYGSNTAASQGQLLSDRGCEIAYEDIQPGDLIFYSFTRNGRYKNISHVAIYAGNGYLVDASSSKGCVVFRPVYSVGSIVMCGRPSWL